MSVIRIKPIAKINIGLRILKKRSDGFHDLHTLFYPVKDLFDEITLEESGESSIATNIPELNSEDNLILRAIEQFNKFTGLELKFDINCEKHIPQGAGLGGGSSDAAFVLSSLNANYGNILKESQMSAAALELGSDVPFFLNPAPSIGLSRGEILQPVSIKFSGALLLVNPGIHVSTSEAFSNINLVAKELDYSIVFKTGALDFTAMKNAVTNDFEKWVFSEYPEIGKIKSILYEHGANFALMTGTGSTVFGIFPNFVLAEKTKEALPSDYFKFISRVR